MPLQLPDLTYKPQKFTKSEFDDTSDNSGEDTNVDGILSMLRNNNNETTPKFNSNVTTKSSHSKNSTRLNEKVTSAWKKNPTDTPSAIVSNSSDNRRVKFDPAFDKPNLAFHFDSSNESNCLNPNQNTITEDNYFGDEHRRVIQSTTNSRILCNDKVETNDDELITASKKFEADKSENGETMLSREVGTPVTELKSNESYNNMIQRIVSSQQSIQDICVGIKELQTIVSASSNQGDKTSKSIEKLVEGVSKSQDQLGKLTTNLSNMMEDIKTSNLEEKENFIKLQMCAENERKIQIQQMSNDKSKLTNRLESLQKNTELLYKEREALEKERHSVLIEKEELMKQRVKFEQDEALFEQRKIASKDELEHAEQRIAKARQIEAKLRSEMNNLLELSDYVAKKDTEANEKLGEANSLYEKARELEATLLSDANVIEKHRDQLKYDRNVLAQERVSFLKMKSLNRQCNCPNQEGFSFGPRTGGYLSINSDVVAQKRLVSIKSGLNNLRK